ncbi:MAG: hypothetical protein JNK64_24250 [Myxococcales bacterium]|nr:hypothetical protein [Myxococcales bacterium]
MAVAVAACGDPSTRAVTPTDAATGPQVDAAATFALTVLRDGDGAGTVSSPAGIACGGVCTAEFAPGAIVTLTAQAAPGSMFVRWSGGGCAGDGACVVTVGAPTTVTATFARTHALVVTRAGTGDGAVTSTPPGIDCGGDCDEAYATGTTVTLVAAPDAISTFAGWSGGGCSGTGDCVVVAVAARDVRATFDRGTLTVNVTKVGDGDGLVRSTPPGITCGSDCTEVYPAGTDVSLSVLPAAGSTFESWSGPCASAPCIPMGIANVVVEFRQVRAAIQITRAGAGQGTVATDPVGAPCGPPGSVYCLEFPRGTTVSLTATPDPGSRFTGWSGAGCSGVGTCTINLTSTAAVTATFEPA